MHYLVATCECGHKMKVPAGAVFEVRTCVDCGNPLKITLRNTAACAEPPTDIKEELGEQQPATVASATKSIETPQQAVLFGSDVNGTKEGALEETPTTRPCPLPEGGLAKASGQDLLRAAEKGDREKVLRLLSSGADLHFARSDGLQSLHLAAYRGHRDVVRLLIDEGADLEVRDKKPRMTPLHWAINGGATEVVALLLECGARVEAKDVVGMTPLHWAANYGHKDIAELLLAAGADVDARALGNVTPLDAAHDCGHMSVGQLLANRGGHFGAGMRALPPHPE
jgi:hypothetical protein